MSDASRRPFDGSRIVNLQPVTAILTENSLTLSYDGDGLISEIEINDGHVKKNMVISRDGNSKITGIATTVSEV